MAGCNWQIGVVRERKKRRKEERNSDDVEASTEKKSQFLITRDIVEMSQRQPKERWVLDFQGKQALRGETFRRQICLRLLPVPKPSVPI